MPIYEFRCLKCGELNEVMQRVTDPPPPCPHCGNRRTSRAVSRTAFHLKGGGWYADLYGTPRPASEKKVEGPEGGKVAEPKPEAAPGSAAKPAEPPAKAPAAKEEPARQASSRPTRSRSGGARRRR